MTNLAPGLYMPDAVDCNVRDITPKHELQSCNHLLNDHAALQRFYEDNGYLLLRQVLSQASVERARDAMLAVMVRHGQVAPGDKTGKWTGKPFPGGMEENPEFDGISKELVNDPANQKVLEQILGEKACMVPNVQYRTYPPNGPITLVHQDGFYSPGIQDYKPVWITLLPCPKEAGGLMIAVGEHKRGYFHNLSKPTPFPVPAGVISDDSWATTSYMPGDVLIVHPYSPHASRANTTDCLRLSFDTRVQSAARPSAVGAKVVSVTPDSITIDTELIGRKTLKVDAETFLRPINPGIREPFEKFVEVTQPGMRLQVVMEGDRATMLRRLAVE